MLNAFAESSSWPAKNDPHGISISQMMREIYVLHTGILKNPLHNIYIYTTSTPKTGSIHFILLFSPLPQWMPEVGTLLCFDWI